VLGDLNADLLKHRDNKHTSHYLDIVYANNMIPLIMEPTMVTNKSATQIDHIL